MAIVFALLMAGMVKAWLCLMVLMAINYQTLIIHQSLNMMMSRTCLPWVGIETANSGFVPLAMQPKQICLQKTGLFLPSSINYFLYPLIDILFYVSFDM